MKLCPYCKNRIIPDGWRACFQCDYKNNPETAAWDGGLPCGGIGLIIMFAYVPLTVTNEIKECEGECGFAIYDTENRNVGILYQKVDDTIYRDPSTRKCVKGKYDVEAIFYPEWREVFGNNRKIAVGGSLYRIETLMNYSEIAKLIEETGKEVFFFYNLSTNKINRKVAVLRAIYPDNPYR